MVFKSNKESRKESLRARWDCIVPRPPKMRVPPPKREGRLLLCPPMSSPNLSTFVLHCGV